MNLKMKPSEIPILMYHEIGEQEISWAVSPGDFERQMSLLKEKGYHTLSLGELKDLLQKNAESQKDAEIEGKFVVITFDDARRGLYFHAYPLLQKLGFKATVFVVPAWIEGVNIPQQENYSGFLSWEELKELQEAGFEIGSHSYSHKNLLNLSAEMFLQELETSEKVLQEKLRLKVKSFSYPYGKFNDAILQEINKKYETAVSCVRGWGKFPGDYARQWVLRDTSLAVFERMLTPQTISVCMIVKDEEKNLKRCLESVQGLADEIIIVDTGSSDNTKEIATQFTDKIYDFQWCDDFSAARNFCLKQAVGDWVLFLDADETISKSDHQMIKELVSDFQAEGYLLTIRNYFKSWEDLNLGRSSSGLKIKGIGAAESGRINSMGDNYPESQGSVGWTPSLNLRLFRNTGGVAFSGAVHEDVADSIKGRIIAAAVPIHHFGKLDKNAWESKKTFYEKLGQKKVLEEGNYYAYYELGRQYLAAKKITEARQMLEKSISLNGNYWASWFNLGSICLLENDLQGALQFLQKAQGLNPKAIPVYGNLGVVYCKKKDFVQAVDNYLIAISMNPTEASYYKNLGMCYHEMGQQQKAYQAFKKAIELNPDYSKEIKLN